MFLNWRKIYLHWISRFNITTGFDLISSQTLKVKKVLQHVFAKHRGQCGMVWWLEGLRLFSDGLFNPFCYLMENGSLLHFGQGSSLNHCQFWWWRVFAFFFFSISDILKGKCYWPVFSWWFYLFRFWWNHFSSAFVAWLCFWVVWKILSECLIFIHPFLLF